MQGTGGAGKWRWYPCVRSSYYYICALTLLYVSSYYYICVLTLLYMCALILLYMCVLVLICRQVEVESMRENLILLYICPCTTIYYMSVLIILYMCVLVLYIGKWRWSRCARSACVLTPQQASWRYDEDIYREYYDDIYIVAYYYICVLIICVRIGGIYIYMRVCPHATIYTTSYCYI